MATPKFIGEVISSWHKDGQKMTLQQNVIFIDSLGKEWLAPAGSIFDGSNLPRIPWSTSASPFSGKHRRASIIHEVYCTKRTEPHGQVHRMFYEAMLADSTPKAFAKEIYISLVTFGPKWDQNGKDLDLTAETKKDLSTCPQKK